MQRPEDSRHAARLLNNTSLRLLPHREKRRIAEQLDEADSFDDLPRATKALIKEAEAQLAKIDGPRNPR